MQRLCFGQVPPKQHQALYASEGRLAYEHCLTRHGFDGPYTISYHLNRPQTLRAVSPSSSGDGATTTPGLSAEAPRSLAKRHFQTRALPTRTSGLEPDAIAERTTLLYSPDVRVSVIRPTADDQGYSLNQQDELLYVLEGQGLVRCPYGDVPFTAGDYVLLPKGIIYRLCFAASPGQGASSHLLSLSFRQGVGVPKRFRTDSGQLRMDAPYCHRDFLTPQFRGPLDEKLRTVWVRDGVHSQRFALEHSPLDAIGWDGSVYPWAFSIAKFQPRVSSYHLPPTWHGTFAGPGFVVCSFVPRPLDFGAEAMTCPYAHTSVDMDEVIFYAKGNFASRLGVRVGSLTLHPAGIPHGPHPNRYEEGLGRKETDELAVMLDCTTPLSVAPAALGIEDLDYDSSF